jgi:DNA primase catalytic subunit
MATESDNANRPQELEEIMDRFDESVKGKFERCADTEWCAGIRDETEARKTVIKAKKAWGRGVVLRSLCEKSKLVRKVARKLTSLKSKITRKVRIGARKNASAVNTQIAKGSNTAASSRPSSISMTMDQIDSAYWIKSGTNPEHYSSCSISVGSF